MGCFILFSTSYARPIGNVKNTSSEICPRGKLLKPHIFGTIHFAWRINRLVLRFVLRDTLSDWHGCCFLLRIRDSSVQPRAHKHLQKRRQSRSNPRAWLTVTCLGGQFSTGSDRCSVSLHFRFHLYRDFQELTCFTSRVPTHCVDLNLP